MESSTSEETNEMGNTPIHHKRRMSGESDYRQQPDTPSYLNVVIPPSKRRNVHSFSDLSKSAPADLVNDPLSSEEAGLLVPIPGGDPVDQATSMMRAASIRDPTGQAGSIDTSPMSGELAVPNVKQRHSSTRSSSHTSERRLQGVEGASSSLTDPFAQVPRSRNCRSLSGSDEPGAEGQQRTCPTVFRWNGGGQDIYVSGTFNNWEKRVPMVKRNSGVYVIIECTPGIHEYKYFIDNAWYHDPTKPTVDNDMGTKNNVVHVKTSDFNVIQALELDQANSRHRHSFMDSIENDAPGNSPADEYGQYIPTHPADKCRRPSSLKPRSTTPVAPGIGTVNQPPLLPPHLLQGILNMDTNVHCDPSLLPSPTHVVVNHLYALSIKDGVVVLSVISRYRQKFVSTVFYKPIHD